MNNPHMVDLTMRIDSSMPVYPGDPIPNRSIWGDSGGPDPKHAFVISRLQIGTHTGTHVDAPSHLLPEGATIDQIPLHRFIGPAVIVDVHDRTHGELITEADLQPFQPLLANCRKILLRTDWLKRCQIESDPHLAYFQDSPRLSWEACLWLIDQKIELIGIDAASLNPSDEIAVHDRMLGSHVILVENLINLDQLRGPIVQFHAAPLRIDKGDGSPVRAYAIELPLSGQTHRI